MILKKPYAFFIKNFKLFHLIIFIFSAILLYKTSLIYDFLRLYNIDTPNVIGKELTTQLFATWLYTLIGIIIIVNIVIIYILIKKDKPYMYYIVNIALYIAILCVYIVSHGIINQLEQSLVEAKTTLAIRDITNIARFLQTISVIFYLIRATGFDIKKFDFVRDLQGLELTEEDSEEIEVSLEFEKNVFIREIRKKIRDTKYYYRENRFILNIILLSTIVIIVFMFYLGTNKYDKVYKENTFVTAKTINFGIKETNVLTKDYRNQTIAEKDKALVVLKISVKGKNELENDRATLVVNNKQYYYINGYKNNLIDLGNIYLNQQLTEEFTDYILIYQIPKEDIKSEMTFRYIDNIRYQRGEKRIKTIDIKLNPKNLDEQNKTETEYQPNNQIETKKYKINISNYEIKDKFEKTYNSCINKNQCYTMKEILVPSIRDKNKVILKLEGNIEYTENIDNITNLYKFIEKYASIEYTYNGKTYIETKDFKEIVPIKTLEKNIIYIEIDKEILNAEKIDLVFNIRNNTYKYILRGEKNE